MTERSDEIAALQILGPHFGWEAFELEELSLHLSDVIQGLPRRGSMLEWA